MGVLVMLAKAALPDGTEHQLREAVRGCWWALLRPAQEPYPRGRRRQAERLREWDRILLWMAQAWIAEEHYRLNRTRKETASLMGLTPRQLRAREQLRRRALCCLGLAWYNGPPFRGRPPDAR
jgi:hypothetical protein